MNVYSIANTPELRSIFLFNNLSNQISETVHRLETGLRINSGKDDPSGLNARELMRADIRGIQAAQKNTTAANEMLTTADGGLANISRMLIGDINNRDDNGLIGLIYDTTLPGDMKKRQIEDILTMIDSTAHSTAYNGKRMLDGSMKDGALFQLGKNVQDSMQYRLAMPSMIVSSLGGETGNLSELRTIDLETDEGKAKAYAIVTEAINKVAVHRGTIGAVQRSVLESNSKNLDVQWTAVSEAEGLLSNADMALESSRLNRAEILAQSTMNAILYARSFRQFMISSLL